MLLEPVMTTTAPPVMEAPSFEAEGENLSLRGADLNPGEVVVKSHVAGEQAELAEVAEGEEEAVIVTPNVLSARKIT